MLGMLALPLISWRLAQPGWAAHSFWPGVGVSLVGVALRLWAAGWLRKNESLATDGPYSWVRHPLYAGTGLVALGQGLMSGVPLAALAFPLIWLSLYRPAMREEEAFLVGKYGGEYEAYRERVPALLPNPFAHRAQGGAKFSAQFSWAQAWRNREYEGILVNVIAFAVYGALYAARF
jgi:protein-S-isoprenylcysteine O-methyltransferase Ste14